MTTYDASIVDANGNRPAFGDDVEVIRTVSGLEASQTLTKAWLTVKNKFADADSAAVLQLEITTVASTAGQITDEGSGKTTGEITFFISDTDYDDLRAKQSYVYDIQVLLSDDVINTLEVGTVTWERQVTISRS